MTLREFLTRLWGTVRRSPTDHDLEAELRLHLELSAEAARRTADPFAIRVVQTEARQLPSAIEALRDQQSLPWLTDFMRDLRYGARQLVRDPGFSVVAILALAIGIGANVAVFSIADTLLLRTPPFSHPERLYWMYETNDRLHVTLNDNVGPSSGNFVDWRAANHSFQHMVAWRNWFFSLANPNDGVPEQVRGVQVSPPFFDMLGVSMALGRSFRAEEEEPGKDHVVIVSDRLWKRRFAADPDVLTHTVLVDGQPFAVIGVLPPTFSFLQPDFEIWSPLTVDAVFRSQRSDHNVAVFAQLASGVSLSAAQADLAHISEGLQRAYPASNADWSTAFRAVFPFNRILTPMFSLLFAAVSCVLLIACTNVANLFLIRVAARQREIAVRAAMGASRSRLLRQVLTEGALVAGLGALAGLGVAVIGLAAIRPLMPPVQVSGPMDFSLDRRMLAFTLIMTCVTAVLSGVVPAFHANRTAVLRVGAPTFPQRLRSGLVIVQIAASLILLVTATLLMQSLWRLQQIEPGFQAQHVTTAQLWLPEATYPTPSSIVQFDQTLIRQLKEQPDVTDVALVNTRPFLGWSIGVQLSTTDAAQPSGTGSPPTDARVVSADYFATLQIPLLRGRAFTAHDGPESAGVALINGALARRVWPNRDPLGQLVHAQFLGSPRSAPWWPLQSTEAFTIVGVATDIKEGQLLTNDAVPTIYLSDLQNPSRYLHVLIRTEQLPGHAVTLVRDTLRKIDPTLGVYDAQSMERILDKTVAAPRLNSVLLSIFATVALLLSTVGVYGVTAYAVNQRHREFAIRAAVGASPRSVFQLVVRETTLLAVAGTVAGLMGTLLLGHTMASLLYGVLPTDGSTLMASTGLLFLIAVLASCRPAWRAAKADPMTVLRTE